MHEWNWEKAFAVWTLQMYIFIPFFSFATLISVVNDTIWNVKLQFLFQKCFFFENSHLSAPPSPIVTIYSLLNCVQVLIRFECIVYTFQFNFFFLGFLLLILFGHTMFKGYHKLFITKYTIFPFFPPRTVNFSWKLKASHSVCRLEFYFFWYFNFIPPVQNAISFDRFS